MTSNDDMKWNDIGYAVNKILDKVDETEEDIKQALTDTENSIKQAFGSADTVAPLIQDSEERIMDKVEEASESVKSEIPKDDISSIKELATTCKDNILSETYGLQALKESIENGTTQDIVEAKDAIVAAIEAIETNIQEMIAGIPLFTTADRAKADISGNPIQSTYSTIDYTDQSYANSNLYTDLKIAELINGAPETLDTLGEIAAAMQENADVVAAINAAIGSKANQNELDSHVNNTTIHVTASEKENITAKFEEIDEKIEGLEESSGSVSEEDVLAILNSQGVYKAIGDEKAYADSPDLFTHFSGNIDDFYRDTDNIGFTFVKQGATGTKPWGNSYFTLLNMSYFNVQIAFRFIDDNTSPEIAVRQKIVTKWTSWVYLATNAQLDELKNSVSDGKTSVANAITAMGVSTATNSTFATLATNVAKITPTLSWNGNVVSASNNGKNESSSSIELLNPDYHVTPTTQNVVVVESGRRIYFQGRLITDSVGGSCTAADVQYGAYFSSNNAGRNIMGTMFGAKLTPIIWTSDADYYVGNTTQNYSRTVTLNVTLTPYKDAVLIHLLYGPEFVDNAYKVYDYATCCRGTVNGYPNGYIKFQVFETYITNSFNGPTVSGGWYQWTAYKIEYGLKVGWYPHP